jgi:hypothetical protein
VSPRVVLRLPVTTVGFARKQGRDDVRPIRHRAWQLESSWFSQTDQEDGGPTIQLPAAGLRCTLRFPSSNQYTRPLLSQRSVTERRDSIADASRGRLRRLRRCGFRAGVGHRTSSHVRDVHRTGRGLRIGRTAVGHG